MAAVYFGLGSNLGRRWDALFQASDALGELGEDLRISPVYETAPVGGPLGQGPFLNCVVGLMSDRSPRELLRYAEGLEERAERVRVERWGPRTLDVDILLIDDNKIDEADLVVPHPRMYERAFVLAPLEDLDPGLVPANWRGLLGGEELVGEQIRRVGDLLRSPDA